MSSTAAHTSWSPRSASATRSRSAPIQASRATSAAAATASVQMNAARCSAEQVLDRQVRAGEQRHRQPQQRQGAGRLREVVAEHDAQQRLAGERVDQHHRYAEHADQGQRARAGRAGVHARAGAARGLGQQVEPEADGDPDDRLGRDGRDRVRAGGIAVASCFTTITCTSWSTNSSVRPATGARAPASRSRRRATPRRGRGGRWRPQRDGEHGADGHQRQRRCRGTRRSRRARRPRAPGRRPAARCASPTMLSATVR